MIGSIYLLYELCRRWHGSLSNFGSCKELNGKKYVQTESSQGGTGICPEALGFRLIPSIILNGVAFF